MIWVSLKEKAWNQSTKPKSLLPPTVRRFEEALHRPGWENSGDANGANVSGQTFSSVVCRVSWWATRKFSIVWHCFCAPVCRSQPQNMSLYNYIRTRWPWLSWEGSWWWWSWIMLMTKSIMMVFQLQMIIMMITTKTSRFYQHGFHGGILMMWYSHSEL